MKILTWQWGRRGAGPRIAYDLSVAFAGVEGVYSQLSLSRGAEIMHSSMAPFCDLPVDTYQNAYGFAARLINAPRMVRRLMRHLQMLKPDVALCAMPAPLDLVMDAALKRCGIPYAVIVHDADAHPGDGYPMQMQLQTALIKRAGALVALSDHVARRLVEQGYVRAEDLIKSRLPPMELGKLPPPRAHGGPIRFLSFGRLLPYKGLDLLADALEGLAGHNGLEVRVVGQGPESRELERLRAIPFVKVENRWVAEEEISSLLGWADVLVLSHREASQSGNVVAAISAGRDLVATNVGGLAEQLGRAERAILCEPEAGALKNAILRAVALPAAAGVSGDRDGFGEDAAKLIADLSARLLPPQVMQKSR